MSSEALAWAFKQSVKPSGAKFTLIALCECANYKTGRITPSIAHLVEITGLNRKSIIAHIQQLEAEGYIADTGERCGATRQIKVYSANLGTVPKVEQSQKRNSPKNDLKQSQKRDTEPSWEPSYPHISSNEDIAPIAENDDQPITITELVEDWNSLADELGLTKIGKLTDARRRRAQCRIRQYPEVESWQRAFASIRGSPFLRGQNERGWKADFDFILQDKSFTKLVEGSYGTA